MKIKSCMCPVIDADAISRKIVKGALRHILSWPLKECRSHRTVKLFTNKVVLLIVKMSQGEVEIKSL